MNGTERQLTDGEARVVKLLRNWEKLCDNKRLVAIFYVTADTLVLLERKKIVNFLKVEFDATKEQYRVVLLMSEYARYLTYACNVVGLRVQVDGSIKTKDNLTISYEEIEKLQ